MYAGVFLTCLICNAAPGYLPPVVKIKGRNSRNISRISAMCSMRCIRDGKTVTFTGPGRKLQLELTGRRMYWNNMYLMLGYPAVLSGGSVYVSESDWRSTFSVLFTPSMVPGHRINCITLDAGHGGNDKGASGKISHEKNITLKITRRVAAILRNCGYQVQMTRNRDVAVPLKNRSAIQRMKKSDLFVSIHVNAAANTKVTGVETFCLTPADAPSSSGKAELQRNSANRWDLNNFALACRIQNALIRRTGAVDRGVKRARFAVLRDISAPGVLVEIGFISNPAEERKLNDPVYQEKIARGIAHGILVYHYNLYRKKR